VTEEKVGEKTYKARFHITFDRKKVEELLEASGIQFIDNVGMNVLVIPILQEEGQVWLWEKENKWREAWANLAATDKTLPLVVPLGDLEDITMVKVEDAFSGQFAALTKLADKYEARRILIAEAAYDIDPATKRPSLQVIMRVLQGESILDRVKTSFSGQASAGKDEFFASAAQEAAAKVAASLKSQAKVSAGETGQEQQVLVQVPIQDLAKWQDFKNDIRHIDGIRDIKVETLSSNMARVLILYSGDFSTLTYFLHNAGYDLASNGDGTWWLKLK
jgi:hypothetical protein